MHFPSTAIPATARCAPRSGRPRRLLAGLLLSTLPVLATAQDCLGPAPDAMPGTPEWQQRDLDNMACSEQRLADSYANQFLDPVVPYPLRDTFQEPAKHAGRRFRYDAASVANRGGVALPVDVFRPCTRSSCTEVPAGVTVRDGPYPTVLIVHGGASNRQLHWWAAQALAEAGYMTVAFDVAENTGGDHGTDAQDVLDWLHAIDFPFAAELRRDRVGIAGHSQGASTASLIGQIDPRIKAIVAWDNLTALKAGWEDDIGIDPPADVDIHTPALGIGADYYFAATPNRAPPEPAPSNGEGGRGRGFSAHPKDLGYQELRASGVDTMLFVLRAGTHLDFTPTTISPSSRYGTLVASYLTLAWFDRYLAGLDDPRLAADAFRRLVGSARFDDSADVHSIGSGIPDAALVNQPTKIAGLSVCDRMSFYYKSRYALRAPGGTQLLNSEDLRGDCYAGKLQPAVPVVSDGGGDAGAPGGGRFGGGMSALGLLPLLLLALRRRQMRSRRPTDS